jgi:hypothetical protein
MTTPQANQSQAQISTAGINLLMLAALSLAWGSFWPVMKFAVTDMPVLSFRALCGLSGGMTSSVVLIGEDIGWPEIVALGLVITGLSAIMPLPSLRRRTAD